MSEAAKPAQGRALRAALRGMRKVLVVAHRWVGIFIAVIIAMASITGVGLAFFYELDAWAAPQLHRVSDPPAGLRVDPLDVRDSLLGRHPDARIDTVPLKVLRYGDALRVRYNDAAAHRKGLFPYKWNEVFVDPASGRILGERDYGQIRDGMINLMPFVYRAHYSLGFGLDIEHMVAFCALLWMAASIVGVVLTFPKTHGAEAGKGARLALWFKRWGGAWWISRGSSGRRLLFDLHQATGLWLLPFIIIFGASAVALSLPDAYRPFAAAMGAAPTAASLTPAEPASEPMSFRAARDRGRAALRELSARHGFSCCSDEVSIAFNAKAGAYTYVARSSLDIDDQGGSTAVVFDASSGAVRSFRAPTGGAAIDDFTTWTRTLHTGRIWGVAYRVLVAVVGALLAFNAAIGVVIWATKPRRRPLKAPPTGP